MDATDKETIQARLLDYWITDLRQDRQPRVAPEMALLSAAEIEEVMHLARQQKAIFSATDPDAVRTKTSLNTTIAQITARLREERDAGAKLAEEARSFGTLLQGAIVSCDIRVSDLEGALAAARGTVARLESEELPPHRVALPTMLSLLRALDLVSDRVVELIRQASLQWTQAAYSGPQTRFGRIDPQVTDAERARFLAEDAVDEDSVQRDIELQQIERYCRELSAALR